MRTFHTNEEVSNGYVILTIDTIEMNNNGKLTVETCQLCYKCCTIQVSAS